MEFTVKEYETLVMALVAREAMALRLLGLNESSYWRKELAETRGLQERILKEATPEGLFSD